MATNLLLSGDELAESDSDDSDYTPTIPQDSDLPEPGALSDWSDWSDAVSEGQSLDEPLENHDSAEDCDSSSVMSEASEVNNTTMTDVPPYSFSFDNVQKLATSRDQRRGKKNKMHMYAMAFVIGYV